MIEMRNFSGWKNPVQLHALTLISHTAWGWDLQRKNCREKNRLPRKLRKPKNYSFEQGATHNSRKVEPKFKEERGTDQKARNNIQEPPKNTWSTGNGPLIIRENWKTCGVRDGTLMYDLDWTNARNAQKWERERERDRYTRSRPRTCKPRKGATCGNSKRQTGDKPHSNSEDERLPTLRSSSYSLHMKSRKTMPKTEYSSHRLVTQNRHLFKSISKWPNCVLSFAWIDVPRSFFCVGAGEWWLATGTVPGPAQDPRFRSDSASPPWLSVGLWYVWSTTRGTAGSPIPGSSGRLPPV